MTIIPAGTAVLVSALAGLITPVLFRQRSIGGFIADVTVEEDHVDELEITEFPVQQGANVTDHSYKRPAQVRILVGYSNSSIVSFGDPNYVQNVYAQFLALQASRQPFDIFTGKRFYSSMLIRRLHTKSDEKSENIAMLDVECRQIIVVSSQTVTVPPASSMKSPQSTAPVSNTGQKSLASGTNFNSADALASGIAPL